MPFLKTKNYLNICCNFSGENGRGIPCLYFIERSILAPLLKEFTIFKF